MVKVLLIGTGGFLGALARYWLGGVIHRAANTLFPLGTMAVNLIGCLLMGALMTLVLERSLVGPSGRLFLAIGFLGSFTTFSTFGFETVELLSDGQWFHAGLNVVAQVVLGLTAIAIGRWAVRLLMGS
jgi:CrcB protein